MKIITLTVFNRPEYLKQVIDGLRRCEGVADYSILLHIEPGNDEVIAVANSINFAKTEIVINKEILGTPINTRNALAHGFEKSDFVIHLEDDVVPAVDGLRYMEFCNDKFARDRRVFSVSGFSRAGAAVQNDYAYAFRPAYTCWFVGWWKNRFTPFIQTKKWPVTKTHYSLQINAILRRTVLEVYPLLSRAQNIGKKGGVDGNIDKSTAHWADDLPAGKYFEFQFSKPDSRPPLFWKKEVGYRSAIKIVAGQISTRKIHDKNSPLQPLPPSVKNVGIPFDKWPPYIQEIAEKKTKEEAGVGDTVERVIGVFGSNEFRAWYAEKNPRGVMGKQCQCQKWKPIWNSRFKY